MTPTAWCLLAPMIVLPIVWRRDRLRLALGIAALTLALIFTGAGAARADEVVSPDLVRFVAAAQSIADRDHISIDQAAEKLGGWITLVAEHAAATGKTFNHAAADIARYVVATQATDAIRAAFPEAPDLAVRVAWCESRLDPAVVNPRTGDTGLFQVSPIHRRAIEALGMVWSDMATVAGNVRYARILFDAAGHSFARDWYPSRGCW